MDLEESVNEQRERKFIKDSMALPCPHCKVQPGQPCRTPGGRRLVDPLFHHQRNWTVHQDYINEKFEAEGRPICPMCQGDGRIRVAKQR